MQRAVELAVAAAVQSVACGVAGAGGDREGVSFPPGADNVEQVMVCDSAPTRAG
ncbi:MAG: hypothetical protein NVS4B3_28490 [Gemmatimonadaceae bacterium]